MKFTDLWLPEYVASLSRAGYRANGVEEGSKGGPQLRLVYKLVGQKCPEGNINVKTRRRDVSAGQHGGW